MYKSRTYDFGKAISVLRSAITSMTGLPVVPTNKKQLPDYPYITYEITDPYRPETFGNTHENEMFQMDIVLNCYAETPQESVMIADDLVTFFFDPNYHQTFRKSGIVVVDARPNGLSSSDFAEMFEIASQSVTVTLRLMRGYIPNFPTIRDTDL